MGVVEKVAMGIVAIAFVTTLILPDRMTDKILGTTFSGLNTSLRTSMGR